jgi:hypothetical protein
VVWCWRFTCCDGERDGEPFAVRGDVEASQACQAGRPRARLVSDERLALYRVAAVGADEVSARFKGVCARDPVDGRWGRLARGEWEHPQRCPPLLRVWPRARGSVSANVLPRSTAMVVVVASVTAVTPMYTTIAVLGNFGLRS